MGSVFGAVCAWVKVLYALNNRYLMNEKGALKWVNSFEVKPMDMEAKVSKGDMKEKIDLQSLLVKERKIIFPFSKNKEQ